MTKRAFKTIRRGIDSMTSYGLPGYDLPKLLITLPANAGGLACSSLSISLLDNDGSGTTL